MQPSLSPISRRLAVLFLAAVLLFTGGCAAAPADTADTGDTRAVAAAVYPERAPYPNEQEYIDPDTGEFDSEAFDLVYTAWHQDRLARRDVPPDYADSLTAFFTGSIPVLLGDGTENAVCSPLNIYMALAMLAETTGGNSRQQILSCLGSGNLSALRTQAGQVWKAHYQNDGASTTILANSLWLREGLSYDPDTVSTLAEDYYASVFQGQLGSEEMNQALRDWLNRQTDGLLEEQAAKLELSAQTVLALASTICYRAKWHSEFNPAYNTQAPFHGTDGDSTVTYLNRIFYGGCYYWGEDYGATQLSLEDGSSMWLILPDEGKTPADLLERGLALDMVLEQGDAYENQKNLIVHLSLPKFDIAADLQLQQPLEALGITDVFQETEADFSAILPRDSAFLASAQHAARVAIDEEGVTAAAYTVMALAGAGMPPSEEIYLTFDRPFLFVIASQDDLPLFAGVVNMP